MLSRKDYLWDRVNVRKRKSIAYNVCNSWVGRNRTLLYINGERFVKFLPDITTYVCLDQAFAFVNVVLFWFVFIFLSVYFVWLAIFWAATNFLAEIYYFGTNAQFFLRKDDLTRTNEANLRKEFALGNLVSAYSL